MVHTRGERARAEGVRRARARLMLVSGAPWQDVCLAEEVRINRAVTRLAILGFVKATCSRAGVMGRDWADRAELQVGARRVSRRGGAAACGVRG